MKFKRILATGVIVGSLLGGSALAVAPVYAATSSISANGAGQPTSGSEEAQIKAKLEGLVGTQTQAEIDAIIAGGNAEGLLDATNSRYIAAYKKSAQFGTMAITPRGPGCATTDACVRSGSTPFGYSGTGALNTNVSNVTRMTAGNQPTSFWYNSSRQAFFVAAGNGVTPGSPFTMTKITRGS